MKQFKFDSEHIVTCSFDKNSKMYSLGVNSTPIMKVTEYYFDTKGFVWYARAVVAMYKFANKLGSKPSTFVSK